MFVSDVSVENNKYMKSVHCMTAANAAAVMWRMQGLRLSRVLWDYVLRSWLYDGWRVEVVVNSGLSFIGSRTCHDLSLISIAEVHVRSGWGAEVGLNVKWDERIIISSNWIMSGVGIRLAPSGLDGAILSYRFLTTLKVCCCYVGRSWLTKPAWHGVTIGTVYANLYASHAERSSAFAGSEMKHIKMCLWWWWLDASSCIHWKNFTGTGNNGTQEPVVSGFTSFVKTYVMLIAVPYYCLLMVLQVPREVGDSARSIA